MEWGLLRNSHRFAIRTLTHLRIFAPIRVEILQGNPRSSAEAKRICGHLRFLFLNADGRGFPQIFADEVF
jgi:hypothetical protein